MAEPQILYRVFQVDNARVLNPFVFGFSCLPQVGKGGSFCGFGFSLANLSLGLVRHHRAALHYPFHVVQSTRISVLTREKV